MKDKISVGFLVWDTEMSEPMSTSTKNVAVYATPGHAKGAFSNWEGYRQPKFNDQDRYIIKEVFIND